MITGLGYKNTIWSVYLKLLDFRSMIYWTRSRGWCLFFWFSGDTHPPPNNGCSGWWRRIKFSENLKGVLQLSKGGRSTLINIWTYSGHTLFTLLITSLSNGYSQEASPYTRCFLLSTPLSNFLFHFLTSHQISLEWLRKWSQDWLKIGININLDLLFP